MNLIIDSGNTKCKLALFQGDNVVKKYSLKSLNAEAILDRAAEFPELSKVLLCNVTAPNPSLNELLAAKYIFHELSPGSKLPFKNDYQTPETLGADRKANVTAAINLFPQQNCLVVDIGTCIKYDLLNAAGHYLGGSISPGISLRFKAMNDYTDRLPLLKGEMLPAHFVGNDTVSSMEVGVFYGILNEIRGMIWLYQRDYTDVKVILTGGDSHYFVPPLKSDIFAIPDLTLIGLNKILELNA